MLHLGGLTSVEESFRDPDQFFDVNFNGTWNLLKALRSASFTGRLLLRELWRLLWRRGCR